MPIEIGEGLRKIWVVWRDEHSPDGGRPTFLAAYDGEHAQESAAALVKLVERAGATGNVMMAPVEVWPLLHAPRHPTPDRGG